MILQLIIESQQISCLDQDGQYADFIAGFKYPNSFDFNYMTDLMTELVDSDESMLSDKNIFALTLNQIYNESSPVGNRSQIILYNDQVNSASSTYGHMKGALAYDPEDGTGFWLTHSIPHYPEAPESQQFLKLSDLEYPTSGQRNAQHLLCLSLDETNFLKVAEALYYDRPAVFYSHITSDYQDKSPYLTSMSLQQRSYNVSKGVNGKFDLQTKNKMNFKLYYKNAKWQKDLWSDYISDDLGQNMYVNTWLSSSKKLVISDKVTKVCEIKACVETCKTPWASTSDHSKLGFTTNAEYVCFSDINFDQPQMNRGGGAACIRDVNLGEEMLRRANKLISGDSC